MKKFKPGDLVYDSYSGRTGVIMSDNSIDRMSDHVQLKFDWFVEVHWISAEKKSPKARQYLSIFAAQVLVCFPQRRIHLNYH